MRIASLEKCIPNLDAKVQVIDERTQVILKVVQEVKEDAIKASQASHELSIKIAEAMVLLSTYERDKERLSMADKELKIEIEKVEDLAVKRTEDVIRIAAYEQDKTRLDAKHKDLKEEIELLRSHVQENRLTLAKSGLLMGGGGLVGVVVSFILYRVLEGLP